MLDSLVPPPLSPKGLNKFFQLTFVGVGFPFMDMLLLECFGYILSAGDIVDNITDPTGKAVVLDDYSFYLSVSENTFPIKQSFQLLYTFNLPDIQDRHRLYLQLRSTTFILTAWKESPIFLADTETDKMIFGNSTITKGIMLRLCK